MSTQREHYAGTCLFLLGLFVGMLCYQPVLFAEASVRPLAQERASQTADPLVIRRPTLLLLPSTIEQITIQEKDYQPELDQVAEEVRAWWWPYAIFWAGVHLIWAYEIVALTR